MLTQKEVRGKCLSSALQNSPRRADNQYAEALHSHPEVDITVDKNEDFVAVPRTIFSKDSLVSFDIYVKMGPRYILYRNKNLRFDLDTIQRLVSTKVETLYVSKPDADALRTYTEHHLSTILNDPTVPSDEKAEVLYSSASNLLQNVLENPICEDGIRRTMNLVKVTVDHILHDERAFSNLALLTSYDYYTYTHSINVCAYSIALANFWGEFKNQDEIYALGLGALLHDIGKSKIPVDLLNKPGKLTQEEWQLMLSHPQTGVDLLRNTNIIPEMAYLPILEHHERIDGRGYPNRLGRDKISMLGRICAIVDCYDAMTTRRAYRRAFSPFEAARIMRRGMAGTLDPRMLVVFILFLGSFETKTPFEKVTSPKPAWLTAAH